MDRANKRGLGSLVASFLSFLKTKLKIQVLQSRGHSQGEGVGAHLTPLHFGGSAYWSQKQGFRPLGNS